MQIDPLELPKEKFLIEKHHQILIKLYCDIYTEFKLLGIYITMRSVDREEGFETTDCRAII